MLEMVERTLRDFEDGSIGRRQALVRLGALVAALAATPTTAATRGERVSSTFNARGLNHVALRVTDVARSRDFYRRHLGLTVRSDSSPATCFMDVGANFLALFRGEEAGMDHYCYTVSGYDPADAVTRLRATGLEPTRTADRVYFPDPDGLTVQLSGPND